MHIALVEIANSHDECLLPQLLALKSTGVRITLVCNPQIRHRNPEFEVLVDQFIQLDMLGSQVQNFLTMRNLMRRLEKEEVKKVVFNTAQGGHVRNAIIFAKRSKMECLGILHTVRKVRDSFTQNRIHKKIKRYLVLAEFLKNKNDTPKGISLSHFYPIHPVTQNGHTSAVGLNITLIGEVENRRKDLLSIPHLLDQLPAYTKLTFLGKSDPNSEERRKLEGDLKSRGHLDKVVFYDEFVPHSEFEQVLSTSHFLLPLIHPGTPSAEQYFENQIPGAMNIAFAHKIPMLIHAHFSSLSELNSASLYYELETIGEVVAKGVQELNELKTKMNAEPAYQFEVQAERYRQFVLS